MQNLPVACGAGRAIVPSMSMLRKRWLRSPGLPGPLAPTLGTYLLRGEHALILCLQRAEPHPPGTTPLTVLVPTQVCKFRFHFTPRYAENAPSRLPLAELVTGLAAKTEASARAASRVRPRLSQLFIAAYVQQAELHFSGVKIAMCHALVSKARSPRFEHQHRSLMIVRRTHLNTSKISNM